MKKKLLWVCGILAGILLLATVVGPHIILAAVRQEAPAESYAYRDSYFASYDEIRDHLSNRVTELAEAGIPVEHAPYAVDESDDLYIDTIYLPAAAEHTNLIVLTTGVHGIEGYIGSVMLDVFFEEIYPTLNTENTGILVVANVNPYGMKYLRRYNENNVDLNRNFILDWSTFDLSTNKDYPVVETFLGPKGAIGNALWHEAGFYLSLAKEALTVGADTVSDALLGGQYEYPEGVYYGGTGDEISTAYLKQVFAQCLESTYENIVHLDIHSGYGPRYNMVIFNSIFETMNEAETKAAFGYDYVLSYDSDGFYATTGDTTDFFYRLEERMDTDKGLFSTCLEFGTIGDAFFDTILSLKYTVDENQNHWYPTKNSVSEQIIHENYMELYLPTETAWREKAVQDFKTATAGILNTKLR
ncbi:MAG: DUF2817 domain-containing protein [Oscillospiraceae bacterium]|nr:DUF2817 domain-containing protein [Oscillospiraceae bacterium]